MSYIDGLLGAEIVPKTRQSFDTMCQLLRDLNIPIIDDKLTPSSTNIVCLGIQVDSVKATLLIPGKKLEEILQACRAFSKLNYFTRKQLQSILGSLMFIHKAMKPAMFFVNRLLHTENHEP